MSEICQDALITGNADSDNDMEILGNLLEGDSDADDCPKESEPIQEKKKSLKPQENETEAKKEKKPNQRLRLTDLFSQNEAPSIVHAGDTDSSEDEDNKYFEQQRLNEFGKSVKTMMNHIDESKRLSLPFSGPSGKSKTWKEKGQLAAPVSQTAKGDSLKFDPICGIRVVNPLVSSTSMQEKLAGRKLVMMSYIQNHINNGDLDADWVTIGVIVQKSNVQKSQKGSQYSILTLSDLKLGLKKVSLFLFSGAFKTHWKLPVGTVMGILNPSVLNNRDSSCIATLSVDNAQKILLIGTSKDFGYCKSWKKNGEKCTSFVNMGDCEYCVYHVQSEYKKFSQRSELQSPTGGSLQSLKNKVLGKNEVFYGGKSFVASKKTSKNKAKDEQRLKKLSDFFDAPKLELDQSSPLVSRGLSTNYQMKDADRLSRLMASPAGSSSSSSAQAQSSPSVLKSASITRGKCVLESLGKLNKKAEASPSQVMQSISRQVKKVEATPSQVISSPKLSQAFLSPMLGRGANGGGSIDLDCSFNQKQKNRAKLQALQWIKKNGPLQKNDPNAVKNETKAVSRKRNRDAEGEGAGTSQNVSPNSVNKRGPEDNLSLKFSAEKMKELMEKGSKHAELLEIADLEAEEKYFHGLEKKEKMEEKMLNTYKLECKAVRCLKCKYLAFSASEYCKSEGHPTKVVNAVKRFFKCHDCGNRTVSLELCPLKPCNNCGSAHWERAPMMREKKGPILPSEVLSIRGLEEKYIGSIQTGGNVNLLVPE
ncbi:protein MCM10 homolog [Ischnura elegans]|uniref:protein MCM10 homolog n=1 Tax=Ischnura elegans TaxID=197161 RepID=UPI001ED877BB|nr:protein MCM10 homolog [Ischnura elegans]